MNFSPETLRRVAIIATCFLVLWGLYGIISAFIIAGRSGTLHVSASKPTATISISQNSKKASVIGTGKAKVLLLPGIYMVVATNNGSRTIATITISKKHTSQVSLNLAKTSGLPSPANINFQNMYFLIAQGITQTQASQLQTEFFEFKPQAHTVAVDASSVQSGVTNPGPDVPFTLTFNVTVDGTPYKATASYTDFNSIRLQLSSLNGNQVFDSDTAKNPNSIGD